MNNNNSGSTTNDIVRKVARVAWWSTVFFLICGISLLQTGQNNNPLERFWTWKASDRRRLTFDRSSFSNSTKAPKLVLSWTKFAKVFIVPVLPVEELFVNCPVSNWIATLDRGRMDAADAVVFHMAEFRLRDLPPSTLRLANQLYVFANFESAANRYLVPSHRHWDEVDRRAGAGFFNLTMTYRRDSDIFFDSISQFYRPHHITIPLEELARRKSKDILWLVSHCKTNSHREDYVAELSRFVNIDKFGKCSGQGAKNPCVFSQCPEHFIGQYKFYLALENRY